jgi:hypothetical protein
MSVAKATWAVLLAFVALQASSQTPRAKATNAPAPRALPLPAPVPVTTPAVPVTLFMNVLSEDRRVAEDALDEIGENWDNSHTVLLLELAPFAEAPAALRRLDEVLSFHTGQHLVPTPQGPDTTRAFEWIWRTNFGIPANYADFKAELYARVDPDLREFFSRALPARVRLDEVLWADTDPDAIPPLKEPQMVPASQATFLLPNHIVLGVENHGEARAYPKRILAWHEVVQDTVGGEPIVGVCCPLGGTMTAYRTTLKGAHHDLGVSGFLYRSHKLLYDEGTKSLWSSLAGKPVVGRLAAQDIELDRLPAVTTTWGEWRKRHPTTKVLSLATGFTRNYAEGAAHAAYFATDNLLFPVPAIDRRLPNKTEVLALHFKETPDASLAISAAFLFKNPIHHGKIGPVDFVVLTDTSGANRVYETHGQSFTSWDRQFTAVDAQRKTWAVTESALTSKDGLVLNRLPAHRVFWFAWFAQHPSTRLVK